MDALPDELLLAILGCVRDAETLLDAVPLVCRRWRGLARDPDLWRGVSVRIRADDILGPLPKHYVDLPLGEAVEVLAHDDTLYRRSLRALLHAPALRAVHISWYWAVPSVLTARMRAVLSALRRSRARVREEVAFAGTLYMAPATWRPLLDFLWRSRDCVRRVSLALPRAVRVHRRAQRDQLPPWWRRQRCDLEAEDWREEKAEADGGPLSSYAVLASLRHLESLHLKFTGCCGGGAAGYSGQLEAAAFPRLRHLSLLDSLRSAEGEGRGRRLVADLVGAASVAVRDLELHGVPRSDALAAGLARCASLRRLRVDADVHGLSVASHVAARLDSLTLSFAFGYEGGKVCEELAAPPGRAELARFLRSHALWELPELRLRVDFCTTRNLKGLLQDVISAAAPSLSSLVIADCLYHDSRAACAFVCDLLPALPRLRAVSFRHAAGPRLHRIGVLDDEEELDCSVILPQDDGQDARAARLCGLLSRVRDVDRRVLPAVVARHRERQRRGQRPANEAEDARYIDYLLTDVRDAYPPEPADRRSAGADFCTVI